MTIKILIAAALVFTLFSCSKKEPIKPQVIPLPQQMEQTEGSFEITGKTQIVVSEKQLMPLANLLKEYVKRINGVELQIVQENPGGKNIKLNLVAGFGAEEYQLEVSENIKISASNYKSAALGLATLVQLIAASGNQTLVPNVSISDKPEFAYRAVMLDLARFWHPIETIKETIDLLWLYKIPFLQLHLSDNRRFTFPLDDFPKLKTVKEDGSREYYTRQELDDLVEYAKQRGIVIIPEVELPGHSGQLFSKYPEIFGTIDKKTGKAKYMHVVNIAKEEAYLAAENIINSLAEVFYTSPYIHLGCDEVYLEVLKTVPEYKPFCEKHNLNVALEGDANELFCYFINRLNKMVKATGKSSIIWEGFHGTGAGSQTIPTEIPVIVWNTSYNHPDSLLKNGYEIINSTWMPWYMVGAMNLAPKPEIAYNWKLTNWSHWNEKFPNVELVEMDRIRGGQICFWEQNHFKVIPVLKERVPVLSERLWNYDAVSDYGNFNNRFLSCNSLYERLFQPVKISATGLTNKEDKRFTQTSTVSIKADVPGTIKYHISDKWKMPEMKKAKDYSQAIKLPESAVLTVQLFDEQGKAVGFPIQKYYQKIEAAYSYKVFGGAPQHGWTEMPDFTKLPVVREGVTGFMTPERLQKINEALFAKVKKEGHIDVRFNELYNPYAVELKGKINCKNDGNYQFRIQTHDGLAELYIDDKVVGKGTEFGNKPEDFKTNLTKGTHTFTIKYFYQKIQNQLSIEYKTEGMEGFVSFEDLVQPLK